jgi:hypothetical protein
MATVATTIIPLQRTVKATNVAITRGLRLSLDSSGTVSAAAIGVRGDYIALQDIAASTYGLAAPTAAGGSIPVNFSGTANVGDLVYSAAAGQVSTTSTNAVLMGRAKQAATNAALSVIELESVA